MKATAFAVTALTLITAALPQDIKHAPALQSCAADLAE